MFYTRVYSSIFLFLFLFLSLQSILFFKLLFIHFVNFLVIWEYMRIIKFAKTSEVIVSNDELKNNILLTRVKLNNSDYLMIFLFQIFLLIQINNPVIPIMLILIIFLLTTKNKNFLMYILGLLYFSIPFFFFNSLSYKESINLLAFTFVISISTDIGAFFLGKFLGGPKLVKSISPNKTWSGFFGGIFLCSFIYNYLYSDSLKSIFMMSIVILLSILSQIGDLVVSFFKRKFNLKNTGNLIPGHGGVIDRLDSFILLSNLLFILNLLNFDFSFVFVL